ncbi:MAG TPA: c-type cytochrome [Anaeromyxobacteraceae bacterium]|jgi:mono/diheme cytochrome c family protein
MSRLAILPLAALALAGCKGYAPAGFAQPMKLGGKEVPAETLAHGERAYMLYCRSCHGDKGDGKGPAAKGLRPPPRDFTQGTFKFAAVPGGTLPNDEDLVRIVTAGLHGTAMLAWDDIPAPDLQAIIQYLKTLSPRWKEEEPGEAIRPTPDPWKGKEAEGVARGRALYHGLAQCSGCHPAYLSRQGIDEASRQLTGSPTVEFRDDMYGSSLKDSDFGVKILPPDFTRTPLRSIRPANRLEDLYRVVAAGVGGTAMPTWRGSLPEDDIWALAHYVESLAAMAGTDAPRQLLESNLRADATWKPTPARP